jgi:hypothetical protein
MSQLSNHKMILVVTSLEKPFQTCELQPKSTYIKEFPKWELLVLERYKQRYILMIGGV